MATNRSSRSSIGCRPRVRAVASPAWRAKPGSRSAPSCAGSRQRRESPDRICPMHPGRKGARAPADHQAPDQRVAWSVGYKGFNRFPPHFRAVGGRVAGRLSAAVRERERGGGCGLGPETEVTVTPDFDPGSPLPFAVAGKEAGSRIKVPVERGRLSLLPEHYPRTDQIARGWPGEKKVEFRSGRSPPMTGVLKGRATKLPSVAKPVAASWPAV